jgi:hypothetical protein
LRLEELDAMVRDLEARAERAKTQARQPERSLEVNIRAVLEDGELADFQKAMQAAVVKYGLKIQPLGLRIGDMRGAFSVRYDPETQTAGFYVNESLCERPVPLVFKEDSVTVAVEQLDTVYFYRVDRAGGKAVLTERYSFDYELVVVADDTLKNYESPGFEVGAKTYSWPALQEGVRLDWLPDRFEIELEGVSRQGRKEQIRYTKPIAIDHVAIGESQAREDEESEP